MLSFLLLVPALVLFLTALAIIILQQTRPSIGYAWLIGTLGSLLAVGLALFARWRIPLQLEAEQWRLFENLSAPTAFLLDQNAWPYLFSLAVLALAFLLTDAARLDTEARPFNWAVGLALTGLAMLAVMAANPVTLVVIWTALDLAEFLMIMSTESGRRLAEQTILVFSIRVAGTLMVLVALLFARSQGVDFTFSPIPPEVAIFMLLAAGLRLGVLPLNLSYIREVYTWRGLGNIMRMVGPASSLVVLARLPDLVAPVQWLPWLLWLSALAAAYGGVLWLTAENEISGRAYWSTALAAMAVASVLNGNAPASIAWGLARILSGGVLFFFSARRQSILFLPFLGLLGVIGLPFTPAAQGWDGLAGHASFPLTAVFIFTGVCLAMGYVRHALRPRAELYRMERWVHAVYPAGLLFLVIGQWLAAAFTPPGLRLPGAWWAGLVVGLLAAVGVFLSYALQRWSGHDPIASQWVNVFARRAGAVLGAFFRLNWLYRTIAWFYGLLQGVVQLLTAILEGDGGILWAMVMLALLISLVISGGG